MITEYDRQLQENIGKYGKDISYYALYKILIMKRLLDFKPNSILEFGCGTGRNLSFLKYYFPDSQITAYDHSQLYLDIAKSNLYLSDVKFTNKIGKEKYDLILVANVFHHIQPKYRIMIMNIIKQIMSGDLFIFEHNPYNPLIVKAVSNCPIDKDVKLLKPDELIKYIKDADIKLIDHKYCLFFPAALKQFNRLEKYIGFLPFGGQYYIRGRK